jgi:Family of unknown function (DUF6114)
MLLIPISGVLVKGQIKLVLYVGIGGVFGILIGALLIACGLALWFSPAHKTFYGIAGVLLAVLSFIGTNLGGFFIGMLLGIIGGSLAFAWTPVPAEPARAEEPGPRPPQPPRGPRSEGIGLALGEPPPDDDTQAYNTHHNDTDNNTAPPTERFRGDHDAGEHEPRRDRGAAGPRHRGGSGIMALVAISVLLGGSLLAGRASAAEAAPAQAQAGQGCILLIICPPSQSPSPPASTAPSSPAPGSGGGTGTAPGTGGGIGNLLPGAPGTPGTAPSAGSGKGSKGKRLNSKKADPTAGLVVCISPAVLTASSATLNGLAYQGVVNMPVAGGGTVQMMKFTLSSLSLSSAILRVTEDGRTLTTKLAAARFSDHVVLYATKLSGSLGIVRLTLIPGNIVSTLLQLLNTLTPVIPLTLTDVVAHQPVLLAGSTVIRGLNVSVSAS